MHQPLEQVLRRVILGKKRQVKKSIKRCQCLLCEQPASQGKRGLCGYHKGQYDNARRTIVRRTDELTAKARAQFDEEQVAAGRILPANRGRKPRQVNPYMDAAAS